MNTSQNTSAAWNRTKNVEASAVGRSATGQFATNYAKHTRAGTEELQPLPYTKTQTREPSFVSRSLRDLSCLLGCFFGVFRGSKEWFRLGDSRCLACSGRLWGFLLVLGMMAALVGCQTPETAFAPVPGLEQMDPGIANYGNDPLREGDQIMITCENVTNLNTVVKIPLSGYIDLPFIDRVRASGKTTMELQEELLKIYASQVRAEVITVKLLQADSSVYVSGAVLTPGKIPLSRPLTALEAIMEAGGFDPQKAKLSKVTVLRVENGQQKTYQLNLEKALKGDSTALFYLKPYDIVDVPVRTFNW